MISDRSKRTDFGSAIWVALALFLVAAIGFPLGLMYMADAEMNPSDKLTMAELAVSLLSLGGAIVAFIFAFVQYRRSEQWRRVEFVAREVKAFESDPAVQNALLMIDWGTREINLFLRSDPEDSNLLEITREAQWRALLPHPLKKNYPEYRALDSSEGMDENRDRKKRSFTLVEARIRDTYDAFLTKLDRFSSYIESKLISAEELSPFIIYWVDAMTKNEHPEEDAAWRCTLLTYINYYGYTGVKALLKNYGRDVSPGSRIYTELRSSMRDQVLAERLFEILKPEPPNPAAPADQKASLPGR
jgi:hypothetical protein